MSVLNQSGEEQVECPLCMEPLEVDDLNFFPCTCGYQICRFCWHRIRTDENGLCPACRKAYSEDPADFIPLSQEQVAQLKAEKRQRDQQRKAKLTESRKHLASVRVVQRNLVFVVGLPMRLADAEVLKRHEYFGKFGKIHKVVINQSTSYAGSQGPSASAYVTYMKSDDALRAIQSVNNITIDGRLIKSSLGTTKYCSHFMKNQPCPKPDCMYLHDFGDPEASFTKEQMHAGKHQEYEKKLHENLLMRTANNNNQSIQAEGKVSTPIPTSTVTSSNATSKSSSKENVASLSSSVSSTSSSSASSTNGTNKENWPHLNNGGLLEVGKKEKSSSGKKSKTRGGSENGGKGKDKKECGEGKGEGRMTNGRSYKSDAKESKHTSPASPTTREEDSTPPLPLEPSQLQSPSSSSLLKIPSLLDDNSSFFSSNAFQKIAPPGGHEQGSEEGEGSQTQTILTDTLPNIDTTEDWAAAFGFPRHTSIEHSIVEDIGKRNDLKLPSVESYRNGFPETLNADNNGFYDMSSKLNVLDMLLSSKTNGFAVPTSYKPPQEPPQSQPQHNGLNGLDQNMSKFFSDFHNKTKEVQQQQQFPNGFPANGLQHQNFYNSSLQSNADRIMLLQQKQLEEQLLNLSVKQVYGGVNSNSLYQNGGYPSQYVNGENGGFGMHSQLYNRSNVKPSSRSSEDDLGFDPFQETQKAFAELMANEQNHKSHSTGRSQINGVVHNQNGSHLPPPPGFVQQNTHMNSFGSKILPFLNMSSSQQQINSSTQNNWPSNYNSQLHQQQQQKNISNCNDWKVLDPAILSSSRHFPLANMPPARDHLTQLGSQQIQQNGTQLRSYDYTNTPFSNFTQQLQPNFNNFSHLNSQQNVNWFSSDINSQISSPPGFRNNQATKQQEC